MVKILTIGHDVCGQMSDRKMLTNQTAWLTVAYRTREGKMFLFTGREGLQFHKIQSLAWGKKSLDIINAALLSKPSPRHFKDLPRTAEKRKLLVWTQPCHCSSSSIVQECLRQLKNRCGGYWTHRRTKPTGVLWNIKRTTAKLALKAE